MEACKAIAFSGSILLLQETFHQTWAMWKLRLSHVRGRITKPCQLRHITPFRLTTTTGWVFHSVGNSSRYNEWGISFSCGFCHEDLRQWPCVEQLKTKYIVIDKVNFDLKSFLSSWICVLCFCVHELCNHRAGLCLRQNTVCQVSVEDRALSKQIDCLFIFPLSVICEFQLHNNFTFCFIFILLHFYFAELILSLCHFILSSKPHQLISYLTWTCYLPFLVFFTNSGEI